MTSVSQKPSRLCLTTVERVPAAVDWHYGSFKRLYQRMESIGVAPELEIF